MKRAILGRKLQSLLLFLLLSFPPVCILVMYQVSEWLWSNIFTLTLYFGLSIIKQLITKWYTYTHTLSLSSIFSVKRCVPLCPLAFITFLFSSPTHPTTHYNTFSFLMSYVNSINPPPLPLHTLTKRFRVWVFLGLKSPLLGNALPLIWNFLARIRI